MLTKTARVWPGRMLAWEQWDPNGALRVPVSVDYVWDANYGGIEFAKNPEFAKKMDESGATLIPGTPEQFGQQIKQAMERYDRVSKLAKIQID